MSLEQEHPASGSEPVEKLNEYLRRMREAKRVTLEKVARDTKLNLDFLHALEDGDYSALPAETYVRIYLRSFSKYLQVDPNETVARYERETMPIPQEEAKTPTRGFARLAHRSKIKPVAIVVLVLGIIVALSFLRSGSGPSVVEERGAAADSVHMPVSSAPVAADTAKTKPGIAVDSAKADSAMAAGKDSMMTLSLQCHGDSSWVKVYSDRGKPWRQVISKGDTRVFRARSTFYVSAGRLSMLSISLNEKPLTLPSIRGIARLAITPTGVRKMSWPDWLRVFPHERGTPNNSEPSDSVTAGSPT